VIADIEAAEAESVTSPPAAEMITPPLAVVKDRATVAESGVARNMARPV
jgi:hypothetical protein